MFMSREQNAAQNSSLRVGNKSFENMEQFKYFRKILISQNYIY